MYVKLFSREKKKTKKIQNRSRGGELRGKELWGAPKRLGYISDLQHSPPESALGKGVAVCQDKPKYMYTTLEFDQHNSEHKLDHLR